MPQDHVGTETHHAAPLPWIIGSALIFGLLFVTTVGSVVATHKEIYEYLRMPASVGIVPEHLEAAILQQVPIGSSVDQVQRFLAARAIGSDGRSLCVTHTERGELSCRLGVDHHVWELLRETYTISFQFDPARRLQKVHAASELFGPGKTRHS